MRTCSSMLVTWGHNSSVCGCRRVRCVRQSTQAVSWGKASKCRPCGSWRCPSRHSYVWSHACTTAGPQMPVVLSCCAVCADCFYRWSVAADHRGAGNQHGQCYHHQWLSEGGIQAVSTVLWAPAIGNSAVLAGSLVVWLSFSNRQNCAGMHMRAHACEYSS
jgi:hypothetical protein